MKKGLFAFLIAAILFFSALVITCKNSPVKPIDEPSLYAVVWSGIEGARAHVFTDLHYPDQCLDNSFIVNGQELEQSYDYRHYYATFGSEYIEQPATFNLSADFCGKAISATTKLCDTFSIITPIHDSTYTRGRPLEIIWTSGGLGFKYIVYVQKLLPEFVVPVFISDPLTDTTITIAPDVLSGHLITIWVFCYRHGIIFGNRVLVQESNNLSGNAEGFFGSYRYRFLRLYPES